MKTNPTTLIVALSSIALGAATLRADSIKLADGTVVEGTLGAPATVIVKTATGDQRVPFALLPSELQRRYWNGPAAMAAQPNAAQPELNGPVTDEEIEALANEVNLDVWTQIAAIGSFRDKPEKRGTGGLIVTKAFNALEENWVTVYSPKDSVGMARDWNAQVARAWLLEARPTQFMQKRWLDLFIKAGEAVSRKDSNEFALTLRELKRNTVTGQPGWASSRNFFTAK
ncbi:MAG: hypothetical protein QOE70_5576 [Chthoniobacter sp.]|jgi:hypothetical protein|nr:hypothetical protein [Chthoniobacter sp.]